LNYTGKDELLDCLNYTGKDDLLDCLKLYR